MRLHLALCASSVILAWIALRTTAPARAASSTPRAVIRHVHIDHETARDVSRKSAARAALPLGTVTFEETFLHVHSKELLAVDASAPPSETVLEHFLRCRATGDTHVMATRPFEIAREMSREFGVRLVEVLSGYRSDKLNEMLRKKGHEVAEHSQHVLGHALDFRLEGVTPRDLARAVGRVHQGGIGIYRESGFVHVDVGPPRHWGGA